MPYQQDKVSDVIAVLTLIKNEFSRSLISRDIKELRQDAVKEVAEIGLRARRFKNQDSAEKTIHDACARRLKPDVENIRDFDRLVGRWIHHDSVFLKNIQNINHNVMLSRFFCRRGRIATLCVFNDIAEPENNGVFSDTVLDPTFVQFWMVSN